VPAFITAFINGNLQSVQDTEKERSWYFEQVEESGLGNSKGYVHYGTFGFASRIVDSRTSETAYERRAYHSEEIPLFYEVWTPERTNSTFVAFQSFQGRSCVSLVMGAMQNAFEAANPDHLLRYSKLLPNDARGGLFAAAPVKRLRLIKRNAAGEIADRYSRGAVDANGVDLEVIISARRLRSLGPLGDMSTALRESADGVITHDGIDFEEAIAEINIGGRRRPVGIFGDNTNTGLIDVTEAVTRAEDGHPTFESLCGQSDVILQSFYEMILGSPA
jgi:hypothetical protein